MDHTGERIRHYDPYFLRDLHLPVDGAEPLRTNDSQRGSHCAIEGLRASGLSFVPVNIKAVPASADRRAGREYRIVTFLLFLVSVAVLKYLLRDVRHKSDDATSREINNIGAREQLLSEQLSTTDLLSLGRTLDAQKTGTTPDSEYIPEKGVLR